VSHAWAGNWGRNHLSLHMIPRNFCRKGRRYAEADAFLVSIPKSGRTWLRFLIRHYLCARAGIPFSIDPAGDEPDSVPRLACSHDLWEHLTAPRLVDRVLGKYLLPPRPRRSQKVILAIRDLRDVLVSLHIQLTKRGFRSGAAFEGDIGEMIRDPRFGADRTVDIINYWLDEWRDSERCLLWSYEESRKDPRSSLIDVLQFLDCGPIDEELLEISLDFADFDNMKAMEADNRFDRKLLQPGDPSDPESFKVRRGVVGGFVDYMSDADARLIETASGRLRL
jgi:hypothetical protein